MTPERRFAFALLMLWCLGAVSVAEIVDAQEFSNNEGDSQ